MAAPAAAAAAAAAASSLEGAAEGVSAFADMQLDPRVVTALVKSKRAQPTLVQAKSIPVSLSGKDVLLRAATGSGKTLAFAVPLVQQLLALKKQLTSRAVYAVVLAPTKELVEQLHGELRVLTKYCRDVVSVCALGAAQSMGAVRAALSELPDVVVATPSRLLQCIEQKFVLLDAARFVIVDEADLIDSLGYSDAMRAIAARLPASCQKTLVSATLGREIDQLKALLLHQPAVVTLHTEEARGRLDQYSVACTADDKFLLVLSLIKLRVLSGKTIVFVNSLMQSYRIKLFLDQFGVGSAVLNAELPVASRLHIVQDFDRGMFNLLVATDESISVAKRGDAGADGVSSGDAAASRKSKKSKKRGGDAAGEQTAAAAAASSSAAAGASSSEFGAARGLDFKHVTTVINFDVPTTYESYVHRVGRTARGGLSGQALTLVEPKERDAYAQLEVAMKADTGEEIRAFPIAMQTIDMFRYRVHDALRGITKKRVQQARVLELRNEALNSERLRAHFDEKPQDLAVLKHDRSIASNSGYNAHLKEIPKYLMPRGPLESLMPQVPLGVPLTERKGVKRTRRDPLKGTKRRK